ncbi:SufE family protein [Panacagrimonas sp.]|uniref:SufE family protein n=1 Tax=Panacagrimonas sp. TaxID=2480088 RepID=UPI003B517F59
MDIDELADTFELLGDWEERYRYLIELGRKLEPMPDEEKDDAHKVRGCMSQVWLAHTVHDGAQKTLAFRGDSDAHIVRGLIALLLGLTSGKTPQEILDMDIAAAFTRLGLEQHISMNRRNGFYAMVERIKQMAATAAA